MRSILLFLIFFMAASVGHASERVWLGKARLWTNDEIGDRKDRWQTGSYSASFIRGTEWNGSLPSKFGALMEYRIRGSVIAPERLYGAVVPTDRRLVGILQVGAFTHLKVHEYDVSVGLDLVFTGSQTRMTEFQSWIHTSLGYTPTPILSSQLGNAFYPTFNSEISRSFTLSDPKIKPGKRRIAFRPFVETQIGVETFLRVGGDFTFGNAGLGDFQVRDVTTGQRNIAVKGTRPRGISFLLGGDIAWVHSSQLLPASLGPAASSTRSRLRAGIYVEEGLKSLFYGVTWLGPEFVGQTSGQVVGSVSLRFKF